MLGRVREDKGEKIVRLRRPRISPAQGGGSVAFLLGARVQREVNGSDEERTAQGRSWSGKRVQPYSDTTKAGGARGGG